jgi:small-conductance mechanosensitive channel
MLAASKGYFPTSARAPRRGIAGAIAAALGLLLVLALTRPAAADPTDGLPKLTAGDTVDRSTPRRTLNGMLAAVHDGNPLRAAYYLDLRGIPRSQQADRGPKLASELAYVLTHERINLAELPDTSTVTSSAGSPPAATTAKSAEVNLVNAGELYIGEEPVPVSLVRVRFDDGVYRWLVSRTTLSMADELNESFGPKGWQTQFPDWLTRPTFYGNQLWQWIALAVIAMLSYLVGRFAAHVAVSLGTRAAKRAKWGADDRLIHAFRRPLRTIVAATLFRAGIEGLDLTTKVVALCSHLVYTALVVAFAWLLVRVLGVTAAWVVERTGAGTAEEYKSRGVRTQLALIQRLASAVVTILAAAFLAMQFQLVRSVGLSLLASAGIASVVLGLAAQKSLAGVIAGIQLFIAQPVRIGDTVEMEGEFGTMEEMNLTYAVVKLWDARRMVVPITKLLDTPFKNLSFGNATLLGTVELVVDPSTPIDVVRSQLVEICKQSPDWNGDTAYLHVTDAKATGITLRALVAAKDNGRLFDLRAFVREKLLAFLRDLEKGQYYPNTRHAFLSPTAAPITPGDGATKAAAASTS